MVYASYRNTSKLIYTCTVCQLVNQLVNDNDNIEMLIYILWLKVVGAESVCNSFVSLIGPVCG